MIAGSNYRGMVVLETSYPFEEVTPERAEALAAALLEAASDARRRTSCTEPRHVGPGDPVGPEGGPKAGTCSCGVTVLQAVGASDWKHEWEIFK